KVRFLGGEKLESAESSPEIETEESAKKEGIASNDAQEGADKDKSALKEKNNKDKGDGSFGVGQTIELDF
ncbi:MAG: hypothetical protein AAGG59_16600, partial [Bacteroidota bacterium]